MNRLALFKAYLVKEFAIFRRYLPNTIGGIVTFYVIFLLIFLGYTGIAGASPNYGDMVEDLIVGFVLWSLILMSYQNIAFTIKDEAQEGTLEQLYMSPYNFGWIITSHVSARLIINFVIIAVILTLIMLTTGNWLNINLLSIIPLTVFTLMGVLGVGFAVEGITLLYKRIDSYLQILQFAMVGLVAAPSESVIWLRFLPASWGSTLIRRVMVQGASIMDFSFGELSLLILIGCFYLAVGYGIYKKAEQKAMKQGILGHY